MSERFFVNTPITGDHATLEGAEAHHLAHVMRGKIGETITLFDGSGCEFEARIESIGKAKIEVAVLDRRAADRESSTKLTLAIALPKGDRQEWLVEKAVELGVAAIVPLVTERIVAKPVPSALGRLRRAVIEASKQCGRNRLLKISEPQAWIEFAASWTVASRRILAHPGGKPLRDIWPVAHGAASADSIVAAIGPEGGFSDQEVACGMAAGWTTVDLGPRILRVETAAIAIATWGMLSP